MTEFDVMPWQQPEAVPVTGEWLDEGPFATLTETEQLGGHIEPELDVLALAFGEDEVTGCGSPPATPRPLLFRGTGNANSRNHSVGYAQAQLNIFLVNLRSERPDCTDTRPETADYIRSLLRVLVQIRQVPLTVDCSFGQGTETATKMFQACRGLVRDGKIGPRTWPELERIQGGTAPVPTPVTPVTPAPVTPTGPTVRVRQDVWTLSATNVWHPTILWYARAIAALKARDRAPFADPRSWRHLAEAHGATDGTGRTWPAGAIWNACEHGSWHFLPWHRGYLHHFERIIREEIGRQGGPADWALPYWNYSDARPDVRRLPPAFRASTWPGSGSNPLLADRIPEINGGAELPTGAVSTTDMFQQGTFADPFTGGLGGSPAPARTHTGGGMGSLEDTPHGRVHNGVGRGMASFVTAGLDPVFWLHHANVDRLWEAWLSFQPTNTNPTQAAWLDASFSFGAGDMTTTLRTRQVLDPRQPPLLYRYDDMPATPSREVFPASIEEQPQVAGLDEARPPELVGATTGAIALGAQATSAVLDVSAPAGPVSREMEGGVPSASARVFLRLENITATQVNAIGYDVYVNVPAGSRPHDFPDLRAGGGSLFGVTEASQRTSTHSGDGVTNTLEITRVVRALAATNRWDPAKLQVTLVPILGPGQTGQGDVKVGRISLFYA